MAIHFLTVLRWRAVLIAVLALAAAASDLCLNAQTLADSWIPGAPASEMRVVVAARPVGPQSRDRRQFTLNKASLSLLAAGAFLDSWTTYRNLTHRKWICGYSPALGSAVTYISDDGTHYDPQTIQYGLCGPSASGQLANYAYDVTRTGAYTETGWVTTLRLSGKRNVAGVLAWNIADDVGQMLVARYLSRRRGLVGRIAPTITFARGLVRLDCGIRNLQFARTHKNASTWPFHVPNESTLFRGPRWWGTR
jgi:hypothetical protein